MIVVSRSVDDDLEIHRLVHRDAHIRKQQLVHTIQRRDGTRVHSDILIQIHGGGMYMDYRVVVGEIEGLRALVSDGDRDVVSQLGTLTQRRAYQSGKGGISGGNRIRIRTHVGDFGTVNSANVRHDGTVAPAFQSSERGRKQRLRDICERRQMGNAVRQRRVGRLQLCNSISRHGLVSHDTGTGNEVVVTARSLGSSIQVERIIRIVTANHLVQ